MFSPDGESLAWSGWSDVTVWRPREDAVTTLEGQDRPPDSIIEEFESLQQLAGIEGFESLGFSADGARLFATDTYHDTLSVWDVDDGVRTATLEDNGLYRAMVSDHAGARLAASTRAASASGT